MLHEYFTENGKIINYANSSVTMGRDMLQTSVESKTTLNHLERPSYSLELTEVTKSDIAFTRWRPSWMNNFDDIWNSFESQPIVDH